jgi:hypothetical protein
MRPEGPESFTVDEPQTEERVMPQAMRDQLMMELKSNVWIAPISLSEVEDDQLLFVGDRVKPCMEINRWPDVPKVWLDMLDAAVFTTANGSARERYKGQKQDGDREHGAALLA